jgi:TolB protein
MMIHDKGLAMRALLLAFPLLPPFLLAGDMKIAYNVCVDQEKDDYEVFIMNLDGSGKKNISKSPGVDWVYHAYGDKLYFISDRDTTHRMYFLYEMDAEGNNSRRVCPFRLEDSWLGSRKDGSEFVVTGRKDGLRYTMYLIDARGKILRQLTDDTTRYFNDPAFSPDGRQIVYRHRPEKRNRTMLDELWIMNDDGTNQRQLTRYPAGDTTADWNAYHAGPPVWEPNRNIISYISMQKGNYSIFTIAPDGSGARQLTPDGFNEGWHAWSPDGTMLVYDGSDLESKKFSIYLAQADGSNPRQLTNEYRLEQAPVFVQTR